jgi:hypothetical protein
MHDNTIEVLVPVAPSHVQERPLAPRLTALHGRRIGWLDNLKANAGELLADLADAFAARGFVFERVLAAKNATAAAPADVMAHLKTCDAVVLAIAD